MVAGKHVAKSLKQALVVPGSRRVKAEAEAEGLDKVFREAGFEWRDAGCSMCIAMNDDVLPSGERSASTSNRNFEGRQGKGSRTHLVSPMMAAAAAIEGHFVDYPQSGKGLERSRSNDGTIHQATGMVAPMDRVNVDTDQMVPKQFLKLLRGRATGECFSTIGATCPARNRIRISC